MRVDRKKGQEGSSLIPKKSLGQNFLMHAQIAERIVHEAGIEGDDTVLEIGPGTGLLTRALLAKAQKVIAVEADADLIPVLHETFTKEIGEGKLVLIHSDIRTFDPSNINEDYRLVANIPYYITGEIIRMFLTASHRPSSLTLLVQKEVAERIARQKGGRAKESILSLSVKAYGIPRYCFTVPRGAFRPAPNVDSAVLSVDDIRTPFRNSVEETRFFEVVKAGFAHKRKLLARNLEEIAEKESIRKAFDAIGIGEKARAEDLALPAWQMLARALP